MGKYQFDQVVSRAGTSALKWDTERLFKQEDLIPLWVADMDFPAPPEVIDAVTTRAQHGIYGYSGRRQSYYDALINWLKRRHQWEVRQDWIQYAPGVVPGLGLLVLSLTKPGDGIVIQPPVYPPFYEVVRDQGREVMENELVLEDGRYVMNLADLEQKFAAGAKMMILCSPHNPVGRVWREEELRKVAELCVRYGVILVSDEIHADLVYRGHCHTPIAALSEEIANQTITCLSTGKTFNLAGLTTAAAIIPNPEYRKAYQKTQQALHLFVENCFGPLAAEAAYTHGEAWLEELMAYIEGNLAYLAETLATEMPEVKLIEPEGTYLAWLDFRAWQMNTTELKKWMYQEAKVALNVGATFGKQGEGFLRINLACPRSILEEGLKRMVQARPR